MFPILSNEQQEDTNKPRQNPAVMNQAAKCFGFVTQALESDSIVGTIKDRVVNATKQLVQATGLDANALLANLAPETQELVKKSFS
jgi:hypothetical protein